MKRSRGALKLGMIALLTWVVMFGVHFKQTGVLQDALIDTVFDPLVWIALVVSAVKGSR